jgi:type IV secretory pathway component VirB8
MNKTHLEPFIFLSFVGNESAFLFTVIIIIMIVAVVPWKMVDDWVLNFLKEGGW